MNINKSLIQAKQQGLGAKGRVSPGGEAVDFGCSWGLSQVIDYSIIIPELYPTPTVSYTM
jgi:hypothetical protein